MYPFTSFRRVISHARLVQGCVIAGLVTGTAACGELDRFGWGWRHWPHGPGSGGGGTTEPEDAGSHGYPVDAGAADGGGHVGDGGAPADGGGPVGDGGFDAGAPADAGGAAVDGSYPAADGGFPGSPGDAAAPGDAATPEADAGAAPPVEFSKRVVTSGLGSPWEITWGPDDALWITERAVGRVTRVDPETGARSNILSLDESYSTGGQDGLLGMALHPRLLKGEGTDYVYLAFTYDADPSSDVSKRTKLRRYTYDATALTLVEPVDLIVKLPASGDHNSGRLAFGPDAKLYYTIGDQGKNQFDSKCLEIQAQVLPTQAQVDSSDWSVYQGKILRLNLDGSIPTDNPQINGVRSHVYSYGHRNAQGIAFGPDGTLYADEQGPKSDDELNLIRAGNNYGWPYVAGYRDDKAYVYGNWSASTEIPCVDLEFSDYVLPAGVPQQRESEFTGAFTEPLSTFYTVDNDYNFMNPLCSADNQYLCWPTIAPSSLGFYVAGSGGIPGWRSSLLITSLKQGSVFRVELSANGQHVSGAATPLFKTTNRYRDLTSSPDQTRFYVVTDNVGSTVGPGGGDTAALENQGAVLEFRVAP
jgi:PQQ-dependent dehydrogenase (s-GDH family)